MEPDIEESVTNILSSDDGDESQCVSETTNIVPHGEWQQTVNGANDMDEESLFSFGRGVDNMENKQYRTSTPACSHVQETSVVQIDAESSTITMQGSFHGEMVSSHTQASSQFPPGSHPTRLKFSTGDMKNPEALEPREEISSIESPQVELDTSIAESSTFYSAMVDESDEFFTASEESTFVVGHDEGFPEVHLHATGGLTQQQSSIDKDTEVQDVALKSLEEPDEDSSRGCIAGRSAECVRLQRSDEPHPFESDEDFLLSQGAPGDQEDVTAACGYFPANDDNLRTLNVGEENRDRNTLESIPEEVSDRDNLNLKILETICEEATNMTIKEALIHSLNPSVRAGLQDGKLLLNETEVLSLEQYCEAVIDKLITDLLERTWSQGTGEKSLQVSEVGLETLQQSCEILAHNIISESIKDTKNLSTCGDTFGEVAWNGGVTTSRGFQGSMQTDTMQELLTLFRSSENIQRYIGHLTASVISSALNRVAISTTSEFVDKEAQSVNGDSNDVELTSKYSFGDLNKDLPEEDELQDLESRSSETSDDHESGGFDLSLGGGELDLQETLEYDAEWDRGDMLIECHSFVPVGKQKIIMRELSFDEHADLAGIDLLAPVFLAVTEDSDEESDLKGLRRKAQSIENLCSVVEDRVSPIRRCRSSTIPTSGRVRRKQQPEKEDDVTEFRRDSDAEKQPDESTEGEREHDIAALGSDEQEEQPAAAEESEVDFRWYTVSVNSRNKVLDLKLLAPYMKVISHGGHFTDDRSTIVVIAACYLPQRSNQNYDYLMEQLFFYIISTLELLATDEYYYLVYFNAGTAQNRPTMAWMRRFYQQIERGLKKRLREMYVVHPNFWLKAVIRFAKQFISSNFLRKLHFVHSLNSLTSFVPVEYIFIPDDVMRADPDYRRAHNL